MPVAVLRNEKLGRLGQGTPPRAREADGFWGQPLLTLSCVGEQPSEPNWSRKFSRLIPLCMDQFPSDPCTFLRASKGAANIPVTSTWRPKVIRMIVTRDILGAGAWLVTKDTKSSVPGTPSLFILPSASLVPGPCPEALIP